jgi:hypothetical protein
MASQDIEYEPFLYPQKVNPSHFDLDPMVFDIDEAHSMIPILPMQSPSEAPDHSQYSQLKPNIGTEMAALTPLFQSAPVQQASDTQHYNNDIACLSSLNDNLLPQEIKMLDSIIADPELRSISSDIGDTVSEKE